MSWGVDGLEIRYRNRRAVSDVSFEAPGGSVIALVGGDGAGKTSILRALAGLLAPHRGDVRRPSKDRIGYVPGSTGVYRDLTVVENLTFAGSAYGIGRRELEERLEDLLTRLELTAARGRLAEHLSGGMRQKLALGTALLHRPELLVLDEATTGLDPVSRAELWRLIAAEAAAGAAVVMSTTYMSEAERASHVVVLQDGRPLAAGSPNEIVAAAPGALFATSAPPEDAHAWRRGARWRVWSPDGSTVPGADPLTMDLEDATVVAALDAGDGS